VLTLDLFEKWSKKYKRSIDCSHPKGFSQKAHCAGRKKHNEGVGSSEPEFIQALRDFLPIALEVLELKQLPKIKLKKELGTTNVPTFGRFTNEEKVVYCVITNRHPNDILRTLAHEMAHYAQGERDELDADSWHTGSPAENDANAQAGIVMREFNKQFPQYMELNPIMLEKWSKKYKKSINCSNPKGFSQKAHCAGRKKNTNEAEDSCPPATQDITLNLKNRQKAINEYGYGPLNPDLPNTKFWMKKVDEWNLDSAEEAKSSLCGNCAAFDQRKATLDCIAQGIGSDQGADDPTIDAGDLGYCRFLKFKCASRRTCDAWVTGGPLVDDVNENLRDWFGKEKWVRMDTKGNIKGPCARGSAKEGKPKCLPQAKAHALGKKGRASAAQRKRREDPNPERSGKAINVSTKESQLDEKCWKGYHKEGNKKMFGKTVPNCVKNESQIPFNQCPQCGGEIVHESLMNEKQDACYHKVKSRYKVWPSAYASGALVQCRKKGAKNWGNKTKKESVEEGKRCDAKGAVPELKAALDNRKKELNKLSDKQVYSKIDKIMTRIANTYDLTGQELHDMWTERYGEIPDTYIIENFADGKKPGRKGLAKRSGVDCKQSVTKLRDIAKNSSGERQRMAHWCANMKAGKK
jgi:hypothetical protein